jgi:hypothetical protein
MAISIIPVVIARLPCSARVFPDRSGILPTTTKGYFAANTQKKVVMLPNAGLLVKLRVFIQSEEGAAPLPLGISKNNWAHPAALQAPPA